MEQVKFMNTKDRCLQCGEKLTEPENKLYVEVDGGKQKFCNAYCLDQWVNAYDDLSY